MDEISNLRFFVVVVETGSFSAAARQLGVTPSAVSRQISQLEESLGAQLITRTTRKQTLTEAGVLYFQQAHRIIRDIDNARQDVMRLTGLPSGTLQITAEPDLANRLIAPLVPGFLRKYPNIELSISMSADLVDLVAGRLDVAIRMGHLEDSSLRARRITTSRSTLYASPDYLTRRGTPKHPSDLADHDCLSFRLSGDVAQWQFETETDALCIGINGPIRVNSLSFLLKMAVSGCGIVMMPNWMAGDAVQQGLLRPVLESFTVIPRETPISAVYADGRHLAPKVRAFIDHLVAEIDAP